MNRTSALVGWAPKTWNPVTGCYHWKTGVCAVGEDCYAKQRAETRLKGRFGYPEDEPFRPTFHENRLKQPYRVKKPTVIFVCSMGDLFGEWTPAEWIEAVIRVARDNRRHTFIFLTKNPRRYTEFEFEFPQNCLLGTTINTVKDVKRIKHLLKVSNRRFLSIEPLLEAVHEQLALDGIDWVIIGAKTNRVGKTVFSPPAEWIDPIVKQARTLGIPVFVKDNVTTYERIQELPLWWFSCKTCRYRDDPELCSPCYIGNKINEVIGFEYEDDFWEGDLKVACPCYERQPLVSANGQKPKDREVAVK